MLYLPVHANMEVGMDIVARDLLQLLADTYPTWARSLSKDKKYKISVCRSYTKLIEPNVTQAHIVKLGEWLNSSMNKQFRKWPPQPLELKELLRSFVGIPAVEKKMLPVIEKPISEVDPDLNICRLVAVCLTSLNPSKFFFEKNAHLKEKVFEIINACRAHPGMSIEERMQLLK